MRASFYCNLTWIPLHKLIFVSLIGFCLETAPFFFEGGGGASSSLFSFSPLNLSAIYKISSSGWSREVSMISKQSSSVIWLKSTDKRTRVSLALRKLLNCFTKFSGKLHCYKVKYMSLGKFSSIAKIRVFAERRSCILILLISTNSILSLTANYARHFLSLPTLFSFATMYSYASPVRTSDSTFLFSTNLFLMFLYPKFAS